MTQMGDKFPNTIGVEPGTDQLSRDSIDVDVSPTKPKHSA